MFYCKGCKSIIPEGEVHDYIDGDKAHPVGYIAGIDEYGQEHWDYAPCGPVIEGEMVKIRCIDALNVTAE